MRKILSMMGALLLLSALAVEAQSWAGRGRMQGQVTGPDGKPIQGAKVTALHKGAEGEGPESVITDKRGRWSMLGLAGGNWTVIIEAEGMVTKEGAQRVIEGSIGPGQTIRVQMREIPKEVAAAQEGPDITSMIDRGNALMVEEKYTEARAEYAKALAELEQLEEQEAAQASVLRGVARAYYQEGDGAKAVETLDKALTVVPGDQESLQLISTLLMAQGEEEKAQTYLAQITDASFKVDPNSLLNLGIQKFNEGSLDEALEKFNQVVSENPDLPDPYYYRGLTLLGKGKIEEAKADFQKLVELAPDHPKAAEAQEFIEAL